MNNIVISGTLTKDPESNFTSAGKRVTKLNIASITSWQRNGETKKSTCWIDVVIWGEKGERIVERAKKGSAVIADGRLNLRSWEKDGKKQYRHEVYANNIEFLERAERTESRQAVSDDDIPF